MSKYQQKQEAKQYRRDTNVYYFVLIFFGLAFFMTLAMLHQLVSDMRAQQALVQPVEYLTIEEQFQKKLQEQNKQINPESNTNDKNQ